MTLIIRVISSWTFGKLNLSTIMSDAIPNVNIADDDSTRRAEGESESQHAARLWATLTKQEQQVAIGYVEYNMGWKSCVRQFKLDGKAHFLQLLNSLTKKLGGGSLRRFTGMRPGQRITW
jgi:hypothetical protein